MICYIIHTKPMSIEFDTQNGWIHYNNIMFIISETNFNKISYFKTYTLVQQKTKNK